MDDTSSMTVLIGELSRISPEPGQCFALQLSRPMTDAAIRSIKDNWDKVMPEHRLLIVDHTMNLFVLDPPEKTG